MRGPGERDTPGVGVREWNLRLELCPLITVESWMRDRLSWGLPSGQTSYPLGSVCQTLAGQGSDGGEENVSRSEPVLVHPEGSSSLQPCFLGCRRPPGGMRPPASKHPLQTTTDVV